MSAMIASIVTCIVGCNSGAPDKQALHVLACDTETGAAKIVQSVKGIEGTTYFAIDGEKKNLYSMISENGTGALVKFALDAHTLGTMTKLCDLPCEAPCHIALSPDEKTLAFAAYGSGTCGTFALTRDPEGGVSYSVVGVDPDPARLKTFVFPNDEVGPNAKRQQKAFAHQVFFPDPQGVGPTDVMGVCDLGCDRIWFFDTKTLERKKNLTIKTDPGDGPRHSLFAFGNKMLYTLNELDSSVTARAWDGTTFTTLGKQSMLPADFNKWEDDGATLATKAAAIKLTADGQILMASNRGYDSIAFYEVGQQGKLALKNIAKLAGKFPRDFELMPGEKFMVVGHKMSNEIQVYAFDRTACTLTPVGKPIEAWRPLCFKFL